MPRKSAKRRSSGPTQPESRRTHVLGMGGHNKKLVWKGQPLTGVITVKGRVEVLVFGEHNVVLDDDLRRWLAAEAAK